MKYSIEKIESAVRDSDYIVRDNIGVFESKNIAACNVVHGFTARCGGVSPQPYDSLNFGWSRQDARENIKENYKRLCKSAGLEYSELALVSYEHGNNVCVIDKNACGAGFGGEPLPPCDGIITNDPGVTLVTLHADCAAIFLADPQKNAIGLAHAGHKGTFKRIGQKLAQRMVDAYGCEAENIHACVGPCISQAAFEVDEALGRAFENEFDYPCAKPGKPGKSMLDLLAPCVIQLLDAGLRLENITVMARCTYTEKEHFFSYRRDKGLTGAMAAYMRLANG